MFAAVVASPQQLFTVNTDRDYQSSAVGEKRRNTVKHCYLSDDAYDKDGEKMMTKMMKMPATDADTQL